MGIISSLKQMSKDMDFLIELSKEVDQLERGSEVWLRGVLVLEENMLKCLKSGKELKNREKGIFAIYDAMLKDGIDKWYKREILIVKWQILYTLYAAKIDVANNRKDTIEALEGMLTAIAGLIEGYFYYGYSPKEIYGFDRSMNEYCMSSRILWMNKTRKAIKESRFPWSDIEESMREYNRLMHSAGF